MQSITSDAKKSAHVKSVERAFILVEELAKEPREYSLTEISRTLNWPKSTVHGLLSTLVQYRYVDQSPETGRYRLGIRFFELGMHVGRMWDIRGVASPYIQKLNQTLGEMVQLGTEDKGEVLYLDKIDSLHLIRLVSEIGGRLPLHCTGLGKVLLAYMPSDQMHFIIRKHGLKRFTDRTITTLPLLEKDLSAIRDQGYAMDDGEIMEGIRCIAAPIFDGRNHVRYAVSVSGLLADMKGTKLGQVKASVVRTADEISKAMQQISV
ncbi:IclR family transcriptional regulator [Fusibacter paucivorans]|uniref:IclR family transcriptional regulator n=1 Tax=Fusibacter paucivorans TaxID=76009 RepID=A0ABS5PJK5_9FIRM|nr:IclR family transcriptional regulator [Fusibacter paucivorans]MBS7525290.1 IclR family transcriptional regulator [Fusibacter paucivorans]